MSDAYDGAVVDHTDNSSSRLQAVRVGVEMQGSLRIEVGDVAEAVAQQCKSFRGFPSLVNPGASGRFHAGEHGGL